ncbi:MAG: AAA family ATPase [Candidatus Rokubacteria bacterium]|nr:AAA family ATPase [Candidatus Rokubacteria bacterium]
MREEIRKLQELMEAEQYVTDAPVATSLHLAATLKKPLLVEGPAGVGKTEIAKVMARMLKTDLIRLQCYEGLDAAAALYEWNYQKQLLHIKLAETAHRDAGQQEQEIFSEPFLLRRPLLKAISDPAQSPVLLVDEIDRCVTADTLVETATGVRRAAEVRPGDTLVSFDAGRFALARSVVKKVVPHEGAEVLRILVGGRLVDVTPEHRFVRYTATGGEVVEASALRVGDRIPLHTSAIATSAPPPSFEFADSIITLHEAGRARLHAALRRSGRTYEQVASASGVSRNHLRNVLQPRPSRRSLREGVLRRVARAVGVEWESLEAANEVEGLRVRPSADFYGLLGYLVADGCFTSDRLCISDKDRRNLEVYSDKFEAAFGAAPRIVPGPHNNYELTYHSLPLGRFLQGLLGRALGRSRQRMVPDFVFAASDAERAAFVRGYFDGEGWVGDHQVCATSASAYLLIGVQRLLSSVGVDARIVKTKPSPRTFGRGSFFTLVINDVQGFRDRIGFAAPAKSARLGERSARAQRYTRSEELPRDRVEPILKHLTTAGVLNGRAAHQTIYDILSGRIRPNVSALRRIAASFPSPDLDELLDSGVVLGEVRSIERLPGRHAVYDFVLEGDPYFVANQVVTHNCDEEFEAFMLEIFAEWQVTIPEIGTVKAVHPPHVILTSNRTRELSDALRRRCLYIWIDYPSYDKEIRIVQRKVPGIDARLAQEIARFMESLRRVRLSKVPGVAETLDWAQALASLHADHLDEAVVNETLGCVLKDADDMKKFRAEVGKTGLAPFLSVSAS